MIPPLVRRCPECGHVTWTVRFRRAAGDDADLECPACDHRFEGLDDPRLL